MSSVRGVDQGPLPWADSLVDWGLCPWFWSPRILPTHSRIYSEHLNQRKHYKRLLLWTHSSPVDLQLINAVIRARCVKPRARHSNINHEPVGGTQGPCILIPTHLWTCFSQWVIYQAHSLSPSFSTSVAALTKGGNEHWFSGCSCCPESTRRASAQGRGRRHWLWLCCHEGLDFPWARTRWPP